MQDVLIIGGGMSGLVAGWAFSLQPDRYRVKIFEPGKIGGTFELGGLKYIRLTPNVEELARDLDVSHSGHYIAGGILLHGLVERYPHHLRSLSKDAALRIQHDHYRKTRATEPDSTFAAKSMNDPTASGPRKALSCNPGDLINALTRRLASSFHREGVVKVEDGRVNTATGSYRFDKLIVTVPIWIARRILPALRLPEALAMKLNFAQVEPMSDDYAQWDYVYTPYTPENLVHRISPHESGYSVEFNGDFDEADPVQKMKLTNELNFLFRQGWALQGIKKGLPGHLLPLPEKADWPENIQPLGRFTKWDPRSTTDVTLDDALELAKRWM